MNLRFLLPLLLMCSVASSCIDNNCSGVVCNNEGVCVQGTCACLQGYEGDFCDSRWVEKFIGTWSADEYDKKGNYLRTYTVTTGPAIAPDTFYLIGQIPDVDSVLCTRAAFRTFAMAQRAINDSTNFNGGQASLNASSGSVTGVYSFTQNDVETIINFTWAR